MGIVRAMPDIEAHITGNVWKIEVAVGDEISDGDTVVILESMKMEIPVMAEVAGTVTKVSVSVGDVIQAGDLIAVISGVFDAPDPVAAARACLSLF